MKCFQILKSPVKYVLLFLKWCALSVLVGLIGGLLGAAFHHVLHFVTGIRLQFGWIILLLPVGGLLALGLYRLLRLRGNRGTNEIIDAVLDGQPVNPWVAPGIFLSAAITHLFGGSAGREGAALQIGGSAASLLGKLLRLREKDRTVLVMSGMSAVFAGLFATPLTACLFVLEFGAVGTILFPGVIAMFPVSVGSQQGIRSSGCPCRGDRADPADAAGCEQHLAVCGAGYCGFLAGNRHVLGIP